MEIPKALFSLINYFNGFVNKSLLMNLKTVSNYYVQKKDCDQSFVILFLVKQVEKN